MRDSSRPTTVNKDKIIGMSLGIPAGDQSFMPVETFTAGQIKQRFGRITKYIDPPPDHKWFGGQKSRWTDDTQLTLAIAESLINQGKVDMDDIAAKHVQSWRQDGDLGFGRSTREAVKKLAEGAHWSQSASRELGSGLGNGLMMKVATLGAYSCSPVFENDEDAKGRFFDHIRELTHMTHRTITALESAVAHIHAIKYCLRSRPRDFNKAGFLSYVKLTTSLLHPRDGTHKKCLVDSMGNMFGMLTPRDLMIHETTENITKMYVGDSYAHNTLPFCYSFFLRNPFSIETLYDVGNAGGDTDTNASIVGGLLGALNGTSIFPKHLIDGLWQKDRILETASRFCEKFQIS